LSLVSEEIDPIFERDRSVLKLLTARVGLPPGAPDFARQKTLSVLEGTAATNRAEQVAVHFSCRFLWPGLKTPFLAGEYQVDQNEDAI